jgi:hypothetical protein
VKGMDVKDIIGKYLKENNYDGLYCPGYECGCGIDDLIPCGEYCGECEPGIKFYGKFEGEDCWLFGPKKENGGRAK